MTRVRVREMERAAPVCTRIWPNRLADRNFSRNMDTADWTPLSSSEGSAVGPTPVPRMVAATSIRETRATRMAARIMLKVGFRPL